MIGRDEEEDEDRKQVNTLLDVVSVHSSLQARWYLSLSCISVSDLPAVVGCTYLLSQHPPPSNRPVSWKIESFPNTLLMCCLWCRCSGMKVNLKLNIKSEASQRVDFIYGALKITVTEHTTHTHNKIQ